MRSPSKITIYYLARILILFLVQHPLIGMEKKEGMEIAISKHTLFITQYVEKHIDPICREDFAKDKWPDLFTIHTVQGIPHSFHTSCLYDRVIKNSQLNCPTCNVPISHEQSERIRLTFGLPKRIGKLSESAKNEFKVYIAQKAKEIMLSRESLEQKIARKDSVISMQKTWIQELQAACMKTEKELQLKEEIVTIKDHVIGIKDQETNKYKRQLMFTIICNAVYYGYKGFEFFSGQ
ncbi:MAG TPA: hypothetical protein VHO47_03330 [Candidatus Babeliales bacterium]|nr:hypothetical protein [Candidatus Babeliales bacterium]